MLKDLAYLESGVRELERYLHSDELYYPIGHRLPQLTLGSILLWLRRGGPPTAKFEMQVMAIRSKWPAAWEAKAERELRSRSELWMNYLSDYREDPKSESRLYGQNVRYRAMINLLGQANHASDTFLRSVFKPGAFIWEPESEPNFPREDFWFLFGSIKE